MPTQKIVASPAKAALFLVLTVNEGAEAEVADVLTEVSDLTKAVSFRVPTSNLLCVVGVGHDAWGRLFDASLPRDLHPFREFHGDVHSAPATPGDLLIHLRAGTQDVCFELAKHLMTRLGPHVHVEDEVHGFKFFEERDLLGFVDGTANPEGEDACTAALVGDEDPDYRGGSYVLVQKYLHDMTAWEALSVGEQERVIGRSKLEDIEMSDAQKPANSHVALNDLDPVDGRKREIVRDNMPFGRVGSAEFGTYFIGYAADPAVTETMLENMVVGDPPGTYDRILDFSTAMTGGLFFAPPRSFLDDPSTVAARPSATAETTPNDGTAPVAAPADGSLGIGSLKNTESRS